MKLGLDFHGVIDENPKFWSMFSYAWLSNHANELHIISGGSVLEVIRDLNVYKVVYTTVYSIIDDLIEKKIPHIRHNDKYTFDNDTWNKAKALYCKENKIDVHIDDTKHYSNHFETPFLYLKKVK